MKCKKLIQTFIKIGTAILVCFALGFLLNCVISHDYKFFIDLGLLADKMTFVYCVLFIAVVLIFFLLHYQKYFWGKHTNKLLQGDDGEIIANLERARFQTAKEERTNFSIVEYGKLYRHGAGIPIRAEQRGKKYFITFAKNTHTLIVGTTGSGKTTTFINPTVQILSETKDRPSMIISDPKGELYALHAQSLIEKGYTVKVVDLRNPYNSIKWNPLEKPFLNYQRMLHLEDEIISGDNGVFGFEERLYSNADDVKAAVQLRNQQLDDGTYEDINDIITVLCPVKNKGEPIWESGAKNFILAIALAFLEDSADPQLGVSVDKYNFYNIMKIATNTENDCAALIEYFAHRNPLSKCVSLSKQVLDSVDKTRGSYLSTVFDKLNLFADLSLCSLTSKNEIEFDDMDERPTALFLQIPDERETRHTLAAMIILQAYKDLVTKANTYSDLTLPRPVYFLLDEFGNLPAIHKLETMITVGRSRNIWLNLVVQSYAQLAKIYDEKTAEIVKSNCNIQVFIGTTDQKTIEEFSKKCGNYSVVTRNVGYSTAKVDDISTTASIKERPLIYPSELQQLNNSQNMGNAIVTVFGFQPLRSKFTPSFKVRKFKFVKFHDSMRTGEYFDEAKVFYDMHRRNRLLNPLKLDPRRLVQAAQRKIDSAQITTLAERTLKEIFDSTELQSLLNLLQRKMYSQALKMIEIAQARAKELSFDHLIDSIDVLKNKLTQAAKMSQNQGV